MVIKVLLLLLGVVLVPTLQQKCDYDAFDPICEWKVRWIDWTCPPGQKVRANAFWGRMPGDKTTCTEGVAERFLRNLNCPGSDEKASASVEARCNANVQNGKCRVKAAVRKMKYDPCRGTFKYMKVCKYCESTGPKTLLLLDSTGSMLSQETNYMPLLNDYMNSFFQFATTDAFWATHKTNLEMIPFTSRLDFPDKVTLDFGAFNSAAELRAAEKAQIIKFKNELSGREPTALTNLGQVLKDLKDDYSSNDIHVVFLVSDFINIIKTPDLVSAVTDLTKEGVHIFPILLNKELKNESVYNQVLAATQDKVGYKIGSTNVVPASEFQNFYTKLGKK